LAAAAQAAECLAHLEKSHSAAGAACERGRALLAIVADLIDDSEILRGAALFPLLESSAIDQLEAAAVFGDAATEMAAELIRIDTLSHAAQQLTGPSSAAQ